MSMVWPTLGSRTAKEQKNRTELLSQLFECATPTQLISTDAVAPIAPKKAAPIC